MKRLTRDQVESRKEKAVRFTDNVLGDPDRAEEIADESIDSYAERKRRIEITNPHNWRNTMPRTKTKAELAAEIEELEQENEELQDQLDAVADIVEPADDDDDDDDDDDTQAEDLDDDDNGRD